VNVDSLPQSSYPSSPPKDRDSTLTGLHQVAMHRELIVNACVFIEYPKVHIYSLETFYLI
jgi:hypothetical protein